MCNILKRHKKCNIPVNYTQVKMAENMYITYFIWAFMRTFVRYYLCLVFSILDDLLFCLFIFHLRKEETGRRDNSKLPISYIFMFHYDYIEVTSSKFLLCYHSVTFFTCPVYIYLKHIGVVFWVQNYTLA